MKNLLSAAFAALCLVCFSVTATAQCNSNKHASTASAKTVSNIDKQDVVDIAISSPDHTTLVAAVKAAGLVNTLKSDGPFTVFAPTNAAFDALPDGTVASLLEPKAKADLTSILTYHVIAGNFKAADVLKAIEDNGGKSVRLQTVQGGYLTAMLEDGNVWLKDANGGMAKVTATDLTGSNGVVHVINKVILP